MALAEAYLAAARTFDRTSGLPGFSVGISPIAFGLSGGLVLDHARNKILFRQSASFRFGIGSGLEGRLALGCLGLQTRLFRYLQPFALVTSLVPGGSDRQPLRLPCRPGRLCGVLGGLVGLEKCRFCLGRRTQTVGKVIFSRIFQIIRSV